MFYSVVTEIFGDNKVEAIKVKNLKTNNETKINCLGIFIFVGIKPNNEFLKSLLELDDFGFIITNKEMHSSKEGIFACGDCISKSFYQVVSAAGEGALACDSAHKYLLKL